MVKNIAIIPARSGSKRIPDKNIINFAGKPLIAYTIEAALNSGVFEDVIVSTDSEIYADIAKKYGAKVPFLRETCNDDYSTLADVMVYTLNRLKDNYDMEYDNFCSLQVSCPLRNADIVKDTYNFFSKSDSTSVLTCFAFNFMNPWWAFKMNDNCEGEFILSNPMKSRSQDNETLYCPTGAAGFAKVKEFLQNKTFYGEKAEFFPIDWKYAVDIDNYEDLEFAEIVYNFLKYKSKK